MQINTNKATAPVNPNGASPCCPFNHEKRSEVAICVFHAVRDADASVAVQLVAGDAAYCGRSHREIEFSIANAGGKPEQSAAATLALGSTKFNAIPVACEWWPLGDGRYSQLAALKQHMVAKNASL
jgi:hypothetical protein